MSHDPVVTEGQIVEVHGRRVLRFLDGPQCERDLRASGYDVDDKLTLTIDAWEAKRSLDQNAYFHAEPLIKWMKGEPDFEGLTPAQAKLCLLGLYFSYEQTPSGVWVPVKASTSELTKAEFAAFIEWLIEEGNTRGINVLPPEVDASKRDRRVKVPA
jgi:hypothetical protein